MRTLGSSRNRELETRYQRQVSGVAKDVLTEQSRSAANQEWRGQNQLDPLHDQRWVRFVERRIDSSIFHTPGWLEALHKTYGFEPVVFTSSPPSAELEDGSLFCRIKRFFGNRLISLPFSDHAGILVDNDHILECLLNGVREQIEKRGGVFEIRPTRSRGLPEWLQKTSLFYWHRLDLTGTLDQIYGSFHKNCVRRKIARAQREELTYTEGRSAEFVRQFYQLLLLTNRRHARIPQPITWFENLCRYLGDAATIRVASLNGVPIASMMTLNHKRTMVYKYGCSDARYHKFGGMALLFWRAIQDAKGRGFEELDMGRTDCDNDGLIRFKEHWGAARHQLAYWGYPRDSRLDLGRWEVRAARKICARLPLPLLSLAGRLVYRHLG